jgi:hypothetical protein
MLNYNDVANLLRFAGFQAKLIPYLQKETVDVIDLDREFRMHCVPKDWEPPFELRAELSFHWDSIHTAYATYGTEGLCALYHDDTDECPHDVEYPADPFVELEIEYWLPETLVANRPDADAQLALARQVQDAFRQVVKGHDNVPVLSLRTTYTADKQHLSELSAHHFWTFEADELENPDELAAAFVSICEEVRTVLEQFDRQFRPKPAKKSRRARDH